MSKPAKSQVKKLVLLDAHAILHRAYHALPDFSSSRGEPTGGLYGLVTMLIRIINELKPDQIIACYDRAETTFRKQIYDDYKAGRAKADEALVAQMIRSRDVFAAFNIPVYDQAGFEADDILGTIVERMRGEPGWQVIIASGDMDTLQLIRDEAVLVYTLKKGINDTILYDEIKVRERFGFGPELLPDWKGLRGDPSDNIIGIPGIGEKTATQLVSHFGSVEQIYETLKTKREVLIKAGVKERMLKLLVEHEEEALFSKTLATIRRDVPIDFTAPTTGWRESVELDRIENLFRELEFKTLGARVRAALGQGMVIQSTTPASPNGESAPSSTEEGEIREANGGGELDPELAIALWLLNSELTNPTAADLAGQTKTELIKELKAKGLEEVYEKIELPLIPILRRACERGILVDVPELKKLSEEYHHELAKIEKKVYELAGHEFNVNSPKQLGVVLFDELKLEVKGLKKTAGGARSTRESELLKLKEAHPIISEILKYRELAKLVSTYIDTIPKVVDAESRLHTQLHQMGAVTGRMSSSEPNLQNIPADETHGDRIRRAFRASPGYRWLAFDYSQIEMRVLALLSGDEELTRIFKSGEDVHTAVAARVFRVAESEVTREQRRRAKVINFGIIYGMGVNALKQNLNSTRAEAQEFYDGYFAAFPKIYGYFEKVKQGAKERGYTKTLFGRRRNFPGLHSSLPQIKAMNERMAMNAPLQGTAADIVKLAMIEVDKILEKNNWRGKAELLLQVHDELIYEVKKDLVDEVQPLIKHAMENVLENKTVPLEVHAKIGENWGEAK